MECGREEMRGESNEMVWSVAGGKEGGRDCALVLGCGKQGKRSPGGEIIYMPWSVIGGNNCSETVRHCLQMLQGGRRFCGC
jgi:hypothetical protein